MFLSVNELFKVGIGPSSSHTMGPMVAARMFLELLRDGSWPRPASAHVDHIRVSLHGSLAFTGKGHGSDRAIILGLMGCDPASLDPDDVDAILAQSHADRRIAADGFPAWRFDPAQDLMFDYDEALPGHANGMRFEALDPDGRLLLRQIYYSVGGGFVVDAASLEDAQASPAPDAGS
ncbi:MAG: serine dehydratase beta chain, partial [Pseudomonadota bacterium]